MNGRKPLRRSGYLKRYKRIRPRRRRPEVRVGKHTGKIRLSGMALEQPRERVYLRDDGRCQWRKGKPDACGVWLPFFGSVFTRAHMAHKRSRGASGSDIETNCRILCYTHHIDFEHSKGKESN